MQWILRGRQLGQAVRNVQRLRQIVIVFAKYGFVDVLERLKLDRFLIGKLAALAEKNADLSPAERARMAFEELGPTFVKLGQLLSTRPDLVPESFIEQFTRLQDQVQPLPYDVVQKVIEKELGHPPHELFGQFEETPLAAASISQVHEAVLKTGEKVVVKVQRPGIESTIDTDISLLRFIATLLERYVPESRIFQPVVIIEEFFNTISLELDFLVEANNIFKISDNLKDFPEIVIPKVYKEYSSQRVLTLQRIEGISMNDIEALDAAGVDKKHLVEIGVRAFFKAIMIDGLFHGDLHGGNIFVLPDGRLGIIDFGMVGRLSQKSRDQLANMVLSLMTEDYENLCYQYAELGEAPPSIDFDGFQRDVQHAISPYIGLSLSEVNVGRILIESTKIATRYQIKVPGSWMMVFKAMLTTEGMARSLDPDFNLLSLSSDLVQDLVKNRYSIARLSKDFGWFAKDLAALVQVLPRQLKLMFRKFNSNDFAVEIRARELEEIRDQLDTNGRRTSLSLLAVGCLVTGALSLSHETGRMILGYPVPSVILWIMGALIMMRLWFGSLR